LEEVRTPFHSLVQEVILEFNDKLDISPEDCYTAASYAFNHHFVESVFRVSGLFKKMTNSDKSRFVKQILQPIQEGPYKGVDQIEKIVHRLLFLGTARNVAARVRAEVSGLPPGRRERRLMAFCQAAIDDSGNEPNQQIFVLAGFVAPAENWIAFSLGWDRALKEAPIPLDYFKFTEAMRLRGQFDKDRGWTEPMRDDQLRTFSEIIRKHASARFSAAVRHEHYQRYIRDAAPARVRTLLTDTPYQLLAARAVVAACTAIMGVNAGDECAFYFDTQPGQDVILQALWPRLVASIQEGQDNLPPGFTLPRIVGGPRFESELDWSPLQASDLLAGAMRTELMIGAAPPRCPP
jgi:hypothetical protein